VRKPPTIRSDIRPKGGAWEWTVYGEDTITPYAGGICRSRDEAKRERDLAEMNFAMEWAEANREI